MTEKGLIEGKIKERISFWVLPDRSLGITGRRNVWMKLRSRLRYS
jgi:hypothetical protein